MPLPAASRGRTELPPVILLASTSKKEFAEYEKRAEAGITCLGAEIEEQHALYLDTIHWLFVLVLWQNPLFFLYIPTLFFCLVCVPYHA